MKDRFSDQLNDLRARAGLTESELCFWLGNMSRSAVGSWLRGKRLPIWFTKDRVTVALAYLDKELGKKKPKFPIPLEVRQRDRRAYVESVRADYPPI